MKESMKILDLRVRNHPGVMSHITGLFARRAYNLEGILCLPEREEGISRMELLVKAEEGLTQILSQVRKLQDVLFAAEMNPAESRIDALFRNRES